MQNQDNTFRVLIEHASSCFGKSPEETKNTYKDYPICLIEYIEKEVSNWSVEIRFDTEEASLTFQFNDERICYSSYLLFDREECVDEMIHSLIANSNYNFKLSRWEFSDCLMKISKQREDVLLVFYPKA